LELLSVNRCVKQNIKPFFQYVRTEKSCCRPRLSKASPEGGGRARSLFTEPLRDLSHLPLKFIRSQADESRQKLLLVCRPEFPQSQRAFESKLLAKKLFLQVRFGNRTNFSLRTVAYGRDLSAASSVIGSWGSEAKLPDLMDFTLRFFAISNILFYLRGQASSSQRERQYDK